MEKIIAVLNHPVIKELLEKGFDLTIDKTKISLNNCFYKSSGCVSFSLNEQNELMIKLRYDEVQKIESFDDLVYLNYKKLCTYKDRGFSIDQAFVPKMKELGLIEEQTQITIKTLA